MKKTLFFALALIFATFGFSQQRSLIPPVQWFSFEDALTLNAERAAYGLPARKIFVNVYADWCAPCRHFYNITLSHPVIADILNTEWIPVSLNGERTDTVIINNQMFVNENPTARGNPHQLTIALLSGQVGYPTQVFIDERGSVIEISPGFKSPAHLEAILRFFGSDAYRMMEWDAFRQTFQGLIRE
ncbi:MAG: thioredoxin family protein [Bacteroidales bacterium]|nr:thioredoxin family protein [Bacteroidales bacterium]